MEKDRRYKEESQGNNDCEVEKPRLIKDQGTTTNWQRNGRENACRKKSKYENLN